MKLIIVVLAAVMMSGCVIRHDVRLKSVDQKLAERGITDADIERAIDRRDDKGNKLK